jgi:NAD(P)-dependent dehydrogenase (short-subunit alcohol dehydrogenase family)
MKLGIGRATALAFARDGCSHLALGDLSVEGLKQTEKELEQKHPQLKILIQYLDVGDEASMEDFYSAAVSKFGRIDFVANVAGASHAAQPVTETTVEQFTNTYNVNIRGVSVGLPGPNFC